MAQDIQSPVWLDGEAYENFMGRLSRISGRQLVKWLALPKGLRWLDVGCGGEQRIRGLGPLHWPIHLKFVYFLSYCDTKSSPGAALHLGDFVFRIFHSITAERRGGP